VYSLECVQSFGSQNIVPKVCEYIKSGHTFGRLAVTGALAHLKSCVLCVLHVNSDWQTDYLDRLLPSVLAEQIGPTIVTKSTFLLVFQDL
jgi:hypothetical protein